MKNTKIAKRAYEQIEDYIDLSIRLINKGAISYSFCYAHITGMTDMCYSLGFITVDERDYIDTAVNWMLPINLKTERH